jgi:ABC-type transport system involved in multi-copper enzyme maturation permease subunit
MQFNVWTRFAGTLVACLAILGVAVRASTAISSEREKQTFDALLTTPLDSSAILWSKFFGCLLSMRWALLWLGGIWLLGLATGAIHVWAMPLVFAGLVVYTSSFILVGLWFSIVSRSGMRATLWTILTAVGLSLGHWLPTMCCGLTMLVHSDDTLETLYKVQFAITPPAVLGTLPFEGQEFREQTFRELLGLGLLGVLCYALASVFFWALLLAPRFRRLTMRDDFLYPQATPAQEMLRYQQIRAERKELPTYPVE